MNISHALEVAARAVRTGGQVARARLGEPGFLTWKGERDVVTEASVQVQEAIVSSLLSDFPASGILAEEGPEDAPMPVDAEHLWIVDPICGSLNFAQGIPYFGLSVALRSEGAIRVGVVYDPCRDELFAATSDTQATLNGRHISVHHVLEGSEAWAAAVVGTDWPHTGEARGHTRLVLDAMVDQVTGCTLMGSPALGICNVAAGRLHAYWHLDLKIWDFAAAGLILQRAGGILTDARGNSWIHSEGGYIASNMVIHGWTLNCIRAVLSHEEGLKAQRLARGAEGQASAPQP